MSVMESRKQYLTDSPWKTLGGYKYVIFLPFLLKTIHSRFWGDGETWCSHMVLVTLFRALLAQLWMTVSRFHGIVKKHQIHENGITFEQVDREFHSDDHLLVDVIFATAAYAWMPSFRGLPSWNARGLVTTFLIHVGPTEFVYYWLHRLLHTPNMFKKYHWLHHQSVYTEPATAGVGTFFEVMAFSAIKGIAVFGTVVTGNASISMIYVYWMTCDFLKSMAHSNYEFIGTSVFRVFPLFKYLLITPSYHSLHHTNTSTNFCLFVPLYDHLGGSVNEKSESLHESTRRGRPERTPDFVFLPHCVDLLSCCQVTFVFRQLAAHPHQNRWYLWPFIPGSLTACICMTLWGSIFVAYKYTLRNLSVQTWVVPRFGFQYFFPKSGLKSINDLIEAAILEADQSGVKVISLGALNKNELLNEGGAMFVRKHPRLKVCVTHGNTLTAACILRELPTNLSKVFITGATSKLGRAIALYLIRRRIHIMMLTSSQARFDAVVKQAPSDLQHYLVRVSDYKSGSYCKTWIIGKYASYQDQMWAPEATHFHQFVVPPISSYRKDCTYGKLAAMRLPPQVKGLYSCEVFCERNVVHACHAGGLLHCLEGWTHHEVGGIDVDRIDIVWEAALRQGFLPV